ncbi:MAG: tetratricopeptide repeat protein [Bacteroidota bacterium]
MKSSGFLLLIHLLLGSVAAQVNVDSLRRVARNEHAADSGRVQAMQALASYYQARLPDSSLYFAEQLYAKGKAAQNQAVMADALIRQGMYHAQKEAFAQSIALFERGMQAYEAADDRAGMGKAANNIGLSYQYQGDFAAALARFLRAKEIFQAIDKPQRMAQSLRNMGNAYLGLGDNDQAFASYQQALELLEELGDKQPLSETLINVGVIHKNQGNFSEAISHFGRGLTIMEQMDNRNGMAYACVNLGMVYEQQGEAEKALGYYRQSYDLFSELGYQSRVALAGNGIGSVFASQGQVDSAAKYFQVSLQLAEATGNPIGIAAAANLLGTLYYEQEQDIPKALPFLVRSLELFEEAGSKRGSSELYYTLGKIAQEQGNLAEASTYGEQALAQAEELGNVDLIKGASELLYRSYQAQGKYRLALSMHERYHQMRDSLNSEENQRAAIRFEYERKALADSLTNEQEKALAAQAYESELSQQRLGLGFAAGMGLLLAVLALILYRNNQRRKQTNRLLSNQNEQIEAKSQQNELLLKEIHHRVKNNLQTISSLLYLQSAHIKDAEVKQAVSAGQHRVESMALIHQKLYQRDNLAAIEMKDYLSNLSNSLLSTFHADPDRITLQLDMEELELDVDTAVPLGLIVNELITNSLKYAFPDGRVGSISISLKRTARGLELFVADDGVGAANELSGTSFGSQLVNLLTQQLGGRIEQGRENGYWTRVVV